MRAHVLIALFASMAVSLVLARPSADEPPVRLPESRAARSFAGVGPRTEPRDLSAWIAERAWMHDADPEDERLYAAWAEWVGAEAAAEHPGPARRAGLCWIAAKQERWADAWTHFERLGGWPDWQAAVTPWLLPGTPLEITAGAGGRARPIPDGLLLRPAFPPARGPERRGTVQPRTAEITGIVIGEAVCDLVLEVEPNGVTLEVVHRSGGSGTLLVDLPMPADAEVFVDYVDWERQDVQGLPLELRIEPREEEYTLYRRYELGRSVFPASPEPGRVPAGLERNGLVFALEGGADEAVTRALAAACEGLLGLPARVTGEGPLPGTVIDIAAGPDGATHRARLVSAVEEHLLGDPSPADR